MREGWSRESGGNRKRLGAGNEKDLLPVAANSSLGDGVEAFEFDMHFGSDFGWVRGVDTDFRSGRDGWVGVIDSDLEATKALEIDAVAETVADFILQESDGVESVELCRPATARGLDGVDDFDFGEIVVEGDDFFETDTLRLPTAGRGETSEGEVKAGAEDGKVAVSEGSRVDGVSVSVGDGHPYGIVVRESDVTHRELSFGWIDIDGGLWRDDKVFGPFVNAIDLSGEGVGARRECSEAIGVTEGRDEDALVSAYSINSVAVRAGDFFGSEEGDGSEWRRNREFGSGDLREKSAG